MKKASLRILFVLLVLCFSIVLPASAATTMNITSHDNYDIISWADTFKLKWDKVTGATGYRISIGIEKDNVVTEYLVEDKYTTSTSFSASSYLPETNCKLQVRIGAVKSSSKYLADAFTVQTLYLYLSHAPAITNGASSSITGNGATLKMSVDRDYGYAIEDCGFYIGTSSTVSKMTKYSFWDYSTSYGATSKGTKYMTISDLEPGTKYYYRAYAVNAAGEDYSSAKNFTTSKGSLGNPVITYPGDRITCYTGSDITLEWNSVSGADSYKYHIKQLSGTPNTNETDEAYVQKWVGSTTKRTYTLAADKLVPGYWYKFVVEACADDADSGWSAWHYVYVEKGSLEKAKVVSPSNTATYPGYQSIKFDWDAVPGADSYNYHIKRLAGIPDRTSNNEASIGEPWTGKTTSTSYTLASSNVIPGSWYKFVVEAVSDTANPSWSEWVYCYIEEVKLVDPEIIKPTEWTEIYEGDSVVVDWDSVAGADGYRCHIKQLAGKPDTSNTNEPAVFSLKEDCGTATKFTLSGSKVHGGYWYKFVVEAYTKSGTSTWSDWVYVYVPEKGTLDRATISSPSDKKVYKWGEDILFTWAKVPNATNYTYYVKQLKGDPDYSSDEAAINSWSGTTNATNRFFTLPGDQVLPDVWYKFVVKAEADGYDSSWSKYTYIQIPDREDWIHAKLNTATSTVMAEAFANNQLLRTFDASESTLETIGARAFENCVNLRSIFLPSSVTSIADNTFSNCPQLTIHCYKDSYVHQYAVKKNIPVVLYGVVEQADMVELSKDSWTINFSEAAQTVFTVSSTGKWTASSSANWLTLSKSSGLNATNVIFKAAANTGKTARTATVTFTCGKASATVTVSQSSVSGKACTMVLNHTSWMPSSSDMTREIVVKSEKGFTVSSNKTWLDYTTENASILAKVTSSALNTTQTGTLTITCKNCGKAQTVTVAIKSVPAPTGVTASSDEPHAVVISWGKVADATYTIERSTNGTSGWTQIAKNLTSTKYVDGPNNINASATYYYRVTACKGTAYSGASAVVKATTPPEQTLTFTGTVGALGDNDRTALSSLTTLSWSSLADSTYKLTLKDATTGDYIIDASGKKLDRCDVGSATSRSLSGLLTEGHTYQVWVGAYNNDKRLIGQAKVKTFSVMKASTSVSYPSTKLNYSDEIWNILTTEWMLTPYQAAGMMASLKAESQFCPYNVQDFDPWTGIDNRGSYTFMVNDVAGDQWMYQVGFGLAQWTTASRKQGLLNYAISKGNKDLVWDFNTQMEYLKTEKNIVANLKNTKTLYEATEWMVLKFEIPDQSNKSAWPGTRYDTAKEIYKQYTGTDYIEPALNFTVTHSGSNALTNGYTMNNNAAIGAYGTLTVSSNHYWRVSQTTSNGDWLTLSTVYGNNGTTQLRLTIKAVPPAGKTYTSTLNFTIYHNGRTNKTVTVKLTHTGEAATPDSTTTFTWPSGMRMRDGYQNTAQYKALMNVKLTGNQRVDTMAIAQSQVDYACGMNNTYNNWFHGTSSPTEAQEDFCAAFVSWCVRLNFRSSSNGNDTILHYSAGASPTMNGSTIYFDLGDRTYTWKQFANGTYDYVPRAGDLIFFGNYKDGAYYKKNTSDSFTSRVTKTDPCGCSHIGFVKSVTKQANGTYRIVTIEGNYSQGVYEVDLYYNSNGEQLTDKGSIAYKRAITYFAIPKYSE